MPGLTLRRAKIAAFIQDWGPPTLTLAVLVVAWEAVSKIFSVPIWLFPAPSEIAAAVYERGSNLYFHFGITLYETILGFALAILLGVPLAVAVTHSRMLSNTIYPLILVTQSVPKVAFAPILLIWFGYGDLPKIIVAFLVAFFPIVVDTATGLRSPAPQALDLARQLSASQFQIYTKIRFPSALPHFFSGLKVAITLAVIGAVIGEFVGAESGLGFLVIEFDVSLQDAAGIRRDGFARADVHGSFRNRCCHRADHLSLVRQGSLTRRIPMKRLAVITASVAAWFFSSTQMVFAEADKVNFLLDWVVYGRATPYFVAFEKGFFSARNIEPKIERGYGSAAGLKRIAAGQADFLFADFGGLVLARANEGLKAKMIAVVYSKNGHAVHYLEGSGINKPADFAGKRVAGAAGATVTLMFPGFLRANEVDPATVRIVSVDAQALNPVLLAKQFDGMLEYNFNNALLVKEGAKTGLKPTAHVVRRL